MFEFTLTASGGAMPAPAAISGHFSAQPNALTLARWASYYNPDTGVDFAVRWDGVEVVWNVPTLRPRFVVLEAAEIASHFCADLGLTPSWRAEAESAAAVGALDLPIATEIVTRWEAENIEAIRGLQPSREGVHGYADLPRDELEQLWTMNRHPNLPTVRFVGVDGRRFPLNHVLDREAVQVARTPASQQPKAPLGEASEAA